MQLCKKLLATEITATTTCLVKLWPYSIGKSDVTKQEEGEFACGVRKFHIYIYNISQKNENWQKMSFFFFVEGFKQLYKICRETLEMLTNLMDKHNELFVDAGKI